MKDSVAAATTLLLLVLLPSEQALASKPLPEGSPGFGVALYLSTTSSGDKTYDLRVDCWTVRHSGDAVGQVQINMPSGIEVLSGDTRRQIHPSMYWRGPSDDAWNIRLRVIGEGAYQVRASLVIRSSSPKALDETDCILKFQFRENRLIWGERYSTRFEHVEAGQRFRYGGEHMVAIDRSEAVLSEHVSQGPKLITSHPGSCRSCGQAGTQSVHVVVTVGRDGRVHWVGPLNNRKPRVDPRILAAARQALRDWSFHPAFTDTGVPVDGWAEVDVPVEVTN